MVVGTALDLLLIQMPGWQMEETLYSPGNIHVTQEEHVPLLGEPQTTIWRPRVGEFHTVAGFAEYVNRPANYYVFRQKGLRSVKKKKKRDDSL